MSHTLPTYASVQTIEETNKVQIGDRVVSYDHDFKPFSWVIGTVIGFEMLNGVERCVIRGEGRESMRCSTTGAIGDKVVEGESFLSMPEEERPVFYPPKNGTPTYGHGNYTNFVEKLA